MPGQLRHLAMSVPDPWKTAEFYRYAFGFKVIGETDSRLAEGVYITDGVLNIALLKYKADEAAQGKGKDFVGLHHIGIWVDDVMETRERVEKAGGQWLMGDPDPAHGSFYEVKFTDPNGVIFDLTHNGWGGAQRHPGESHNQEGPSRKFVERFTERRAKARAELEKATGE
jgi:lactoylglutathione lyase